MRLQPNEFSSYELTDAETAKGWTFSLQTQAVLRNELVNVSREVLDVRAEGRDKEEEERKHLAYLQGQKDVLIHLLAQCAQYSEDIERLVQEEAEAQVQQNQQ